MQGRDIKEDNKEENEGPKITNANIGDYINYNVPYTDIYTGQEYKAVNGWRYLGDDSNGNHLMVSTGIPGTFYYYPDVRSEENETDTSPRKIKNRLRNNFENINFVTNFEMNAIVFKKIGGYTEGINHALASSSKAQALIYLNNKYWIIGDNDSSDLLYIDDENRFSYRSIDNFGIRPVVVLSAFTKLVQNQNGVWEIK